MDTIVCVKEIIDPELSLAKFRNIENIVIPPHDAPRVLNPFDEQAVEAALRIKDLIGGKITILSLGYNLRREVIKKPLGMGADELILLEDEAFEGGDSWSIAYPIAQAIKKIGRYDLILCGRQAADWDSGQVGLGIAEMLGVPSITNARKVEIIDRKARVERVTIDSYEIVEVDLPVLVTISNELGLPRLPTLPKIKEAARKKPIIWKPEDIGLNRSEIGKSGRKLKLLQLFEPVRESNCEFVQGETPEQAAIQLTQRLRETKVI